jgi:hypothetical protein
MLGGLGVIVPAFFFGPHQAAGGASGNACSCCCACSRLFLNGAGFNARLISPMPNSQHRRCPVALLHWRPPPPSVGPFEEEVRSLENRRIEFSQRPSIFYGSSSIRLWKTLSRDFIGYPVVNCGFGGSRLSDCVRYVSRLVLRLKPAAVVLYAGDNDLGARRPARLGVCLVPGALPCATWLFGADANCLYLRQTVLGLDPLHRQHPSLQPDGAGVPGCFSPGLKRWPLALFHV